MLRIKPQTEGGLQMYRDAGKLIFWRRMAPKLKTMANDDSLKELKKKLKLKNKQEKGRESDNNSNLGQKLKNINHS